MEGEIVIQVPKRVKGWLRNKIVWREQGFLFTMETWMMMSNTHKLPLNELNALDDHFTKSAFYHAAQWYNIAHRKPIDFNEIDVKLWDDTIPNKDYQALLQTMLDSQIGGERLGDLAEKSDLKKKSGQKK